LLRLFEGWLEPRVDPLALVEMARHHGWALNEWLAEYLKHCYVSGWAMGRAAETVNAVQTSYQWLRGSLAGPWGLLRTWHMLEPPEVHPPAPRSVVEAMAAVALSWKWWRVATILLTGFWALLRPKECWSLTRESFALPHEHQHGNMILIFLGPNKVALRGPKRQYAKVDQPYVISFLLKVLSALPASERIWNGSSATFRTRFDDILKVLSIPIGSILPSSLRTGGATTLFQLWDENVQKLLWRGRWQSQRILEVIWMLILFWRR